MQSSSLSPDMEPIMNDFFRELEKVFLFLVKFSYNMKEIDYDASVIFLSGKLYFLYYNFFFIRNKNRRICYS